MNAARPIKSSIVAARLPYFLLLTIAVFSGFWVDAQTKFTTNVSNQELGQKDYLQIEFVIENAKQIEDLVPPDFTGFTVVQGPIQSSGMSIVNGNMSQYKSISFVLQPARTGKFTIEGASAVVDGKKMKSNAVQVVVHAGGSGAAPGGNSNSGIPPGMSNPFGGLFGPDPSAAERREVDKDYVLKPGENVKEKIRKNIFVKVQVDKSSCYVGEPIVATYKLYTRLSSESRVTKRPSLNGFSVYDMIDPASDAVSVEKLNGKDFTVHTIRKTQLIPLQAGTIDLDPVEVENTVHFVKSGHAEPHRNPTSIRDLINQMEEEEQMGPEVTQNVTLDTKPYTITVKPLPDNKPASFNGAVGNFTVEASLPNASVAAQDEASLHVVVKGKGNLPMVTAPTVAWPAEFDTFDPVAKEDINKTVAPISGSKTFDYTFSPKTPGHYTIPAINFSYFDPASQSYKTATTAPLEIQVTPAARKHNKTPVNIASVPAVGGDSDWYRSWWVWAAVLVLFGGIGVYLVRRGRRAQKVRSDAKAQPSKDAAPVGAAGSAGRDSVYMPVASVVKRDPFNMPSLSLPSEKVIEEKTEQKETAGVTTSAYISAAPQVAPPLQDARQLFDEGDYKGFYREVNRAVWKAISKKLDLPASELNKQNALRHLKLRGWDEPALLSLENILNECEMNLYTPAYDRYNAQQLLQQAEWMLDRLA